MENTEMNPKQRLSQIRRLRILIDQRERELDSLRAARFGCVSGVDYGRTPVKGSRRVGGSFEEASIKSVDLEEETAALIAQYNELRHAIIGQIQQLDKLEHMQILYKRYVEEKRWEQIAEEMGYDSVYIRSLHGKALFAFGLLISAGR